MKRFFLVSLLIVFTCQLWAQTSAKPSGQPASYLKNTFWDLDKYLWSYAHQKSMPQGKQVIDFKSIDNWPALGNELRISRDGKYVAYIIESKIELGIKAGEQPDSLIVKSISGPWQYVVIDGKPGFFSADSKQYIYEDSAGLCILELGNGLKQVIKNITGYQKQENVGQDIGMTRWLAWELKDDDKTVILQDLLTGSKLAYNRVARYGFDGSGSWFFCQLEGQEKELLIHNLAGDKEQLFPHVASFVFSGNGKNLLVKDFNNSLDYFDLTAGRSATIWATPDSTTQIVNSAFDEKGEQLVFVVQQGSGNSIWYWTAGMKKAVMKVNDQSAYIGTQLRIGEGVSFTPDGRYIQFVLYPPCKSQQVDPNAAQVDIWSYEDKTLQSTQFRQLNQQKSYKAIVDPATGYIVQLEMAENELLRFITADYAVIAKSCCGDRFWEKGYGRDSARIVSLRDGSCRLLPIWSNLTNMIVPSPNGRYLVYFDAENGCNYFSYELQTGRLINLTRHLPAYQFGYRTQYLQTTKKSKEAAAIVAGPIVAAWIGENAFLVFDNYDLWQLDPSGKKAPMNITQGFGIKNHTRFWIGDEIYRFNQHDTLLLNAFNEATKYRGFYRKILSINGNPEQLFMEPCSIESIRCNEAFTGKLLSGSTWVMKKETDIEAPNVFLTNDLKTYKQLTFLAPQQNYTLYTAELHHFKQLDGTIGQGILYKPENFDPKKKYPVIISFYGPGQTDHLYKYMKPLYPTDPTVFDKPAWIVNRGYLLFVPDVYFKQGLWGLGTMNSIDGAVKYLSKLPYVDSGHLGATGHSNSGRFGYYLFTHSRSFAAMSIGAGIPNLLSYSLKLNENDGGHLEEEEVTAYGAGGLGSLWKNKTLWWDHTAVVQADKATSPLLMFHNKRDGGYIGAAQMYISLRRLEKKAWWLQYDLGGHILWKLKDQRDFTVRFTQFFDHYLKCAPAPKWMTEGIPAALKTIESRFELDAAGSCANKSKAPCYVCDAWNKQYKRTPAMFEKPISEWKLDKDIQDELDKKTTAERARLDKEGLPEQKRVVDILKNGYPGENKKN